jgi:hypothetical protein
LKYSEVELGPFEKNTFFPPYPLIIVWKPYPIPKISTMLQELEGFSYATALDLNMGYYTIRLNPAASEVCTIIFP